MQRSPAWLKQSRVFLSSLKSFELQFDFHEELRFLISIDNRDYMTAPMNKNQLHEE